MSSFKTLIECMRVMRRTSPELKESILRESDDYSDLISQISDILGSDYVDQIKPNKVLIRNGENGKPANRVSVSRMLSDLGLKKNPEGSQGSYITDDEKYSLRLSKNESGEYILTIRNNTYDGDRKFTQEEIDKVNAMLSKLDPEFFISSHNTGTIEVTMLDDNKLMELPRWRQEVTPKLIKRSDGKIKNIAPYGSVYSSIDGFLNSTEIKNVLKYHSK